MKCFMKIMMIFFCGLFNVMIVTGLIFIAKIDINGLLKDQLFKVLFVIFATGIITISVFEKDVLLK